MSGVERRELSGDLMCGLANWHPAWMQRFANTKMFMAVYGLLGTIQAMSYMYFVVTLTTIEKRFKIPSQTTGIILSGNEISQILLSLILSYIGGQRNRPRWIAWGIVFCGLSCYILALPHFIYGAGEDVLQLTKEYVENINDQDNLTRSTLSLVNSTIGQSQQLCGSTKFTEECNALLSVVPLILIFLSQFVLGIGNTLYYSLGQTYLDDNTKKTNTPLMLAMAMTLRMIGPIVGFFLGYASLNMFIDPTKTPLIDNKDPRWLGAWWFGWMILGTLMVLFSGLIGLFPKQLPKKHSSLYNSHMPQVLMQESSDEVLPLGRSFSSNAALDAPTTVPNDFPKLKDFPTALMRLLRNKLLIFNIVSGIFYVLGAAGYMTFLTKYMEVQFHRTSQSATIVVGPMSICGMVTGIIGSGLIISKLKPNPGKVLFWNVIVGGVYIAGQISFMFLFCGDTVSQLNAHNLNLTLPCNTNCGCENVPYAPVCHKPTETTYFSACHAGCQTWHANEKTYSNCTCLIADTLRLPGQKMATDITTSTTLLSISPITDFPEISIHSTFDPTPPAASVDNKDGIVRRIRRSMQTLRDELTPGVCLEGCSTAFWTFTTVSMVIHWFGSSGRIGNILVNYRAVSTQDKSFAQGLSLMMISMFALIPGPIIFGRIIDTTCLVWTKTCSGNGNCQLYDQTSFRYFVNALACGLTAIGLIFDVLVWYHGQHLDLYGDKEAQRLEELKRKNKAITPLLARH